MADSAWPGAVPLRVLQSLPWLCPESCPTVVVVPTDAPVAAAAPAVLLPRWGRGYPGGPARSHRQGYALCPPHTTGFQAPQGTEHPGGGLQPPPGGGWGVSPPPTPPPALPPLLPVCLPVPPPLPLSIAAIPLLTQPCIFPAARTPLALSLSIPPSSAHVPHPSASYSLSPFLFHLSLHPSVCQFVPADSGLDSGECLLVCASLCCSLLILCSLGRACPYPIHPPVHPSPLIPRGLTPYLLCLPTLSA